jgi:predicted MFS family arabinose efflux permease
MTTTDSLPARRNLTPGEWALVLLLAAINFNHILDFVIVMPLGDSLRHELHITPFQFGMVVSAYGIAATVAGVLATGVVDRFDRKTVLLAVFGGFTLATLYCGLAPDYWQLVFARVLAGACGGLTASSVMAVVGDVIPNQRRGRAIGVLTSAFAVASVIGLPSGLYLAELFGRGAPFLAIAGVSAAVWVVAAVRLPSLTAHRQAGRVNPLAQFAAVVRRPNHLKAFAFMLTLVLGTFTIIPFLAPYLQANCGRGAGDVRLVYAVAGVCTLVMMNLIGWLTDRVGQRPVFVATASAAIVMTLVLTNLPPVGVWAAAAAASAFMVSAAGRVVPAQAMMLKAADRGLIGPFTSLNTAVQSFATCVGPVIAGTIIGEEYEGGPLTNYWLAGVVAVAFGLTALGLSFLLRPVKVPPPVAAPALPTAAPPQPEPSPV